MWRKALLGGVGASLLAGGAAFELDRRRLLKKRDADPEWHELTSPLPGRPQEVLSADGTRLHVEVFGPDSAPSIVLAHGWLEAIALWHHQIRDLSQDFRIVAYDQRGHGRSGRPATGAYNQDTLADDLQAVLDGCLPSGARCLIAGHSMGAMGIIAWAAHHEDVLGDRVAAVALINTGISELVRRAEVLGAHAGELVHGLALRALFMTPLAWPSSLDPVSFQLSRLIAFSPDASVGRVAFANRMFTSSHPGMRAAFARMYITLDLGPEASRLAAPAIVIGGRLDRLLPVWHSEQLAAALPDLIEYVELADAGHMSPIEAPGQVTHHLRRMARACLPVRPAALERRSDSRLWEAVAMPAAGHTPEPDPGGVTAEDVAEMSQGAPGQASATARELSSNSPDGGRKRRRRGAARETGVEEEDAASS